MNHPVWLPRPLKSRPEQMVNIVGGLLSALGREHIYLSIARLIYAGNRSCKVGSYDLSMAYDEQLAGRPCDCLRTAAGAGLNHG
jgi:hypothetical protein